MAKSKTSRNGQSKTSTNGHAAQNGKGADKIEYVSLTDETRKRYLNYAMSVITSRALPDVRDGLKPVQRRILYVMYQELRLTADGKTRKCAKICGDTTGNYHPHGDVAVYDALVRLAQDFSLRNPLVIGQGNFGSIMGLNAAASRYTEAKLSAIAEQIMNELRYQTVETRPNYDGTREEPVVLPARFPNLLVNGTQGIAVGMATKIPPHNLGEIIRACVALIQNPETSVAQLMRSVKGPDFPLGGRIVTDKTTLRTIYEEGTGSVKVRGEWRFDTKGTKGKEDKSKLVIFSIPYDVRSGPLVAEIGAIVASRKIPQLLDVADETDDKNGLRIVLELKPGSDPDAVMSYLYKHTALEQNFPVNLTCLAPNQLGVLVPARLSLKEMLQHFLDFRFATVRKRFEFQLKQLEARIHILNGFVIIFDGLERALKIIRKSSGKQDAAEKLMQEFPLDEIQTYAILELQLYRISSLEIGRIREELEEKLKEAERIRRILASDKELWNVVQGELEEIAKEFGDNRRTSIGSSEDILEYDPQAYIQRENTNVVVTRDGWIKRIGKISSIETLRVREGDSVQAVVPGTTLDFVVLFSSDGIAYTLPINDIPASTGYGEPISKHVKLADGAKILTVITTDSRFTWEEFDTGDEIPGPHMMIATAMGQVIRFPFNALRTASTKAGRRYCRLMEKDHVVMAEMIVDAETMFLATQDARVIHFPISEVPVVGNPAKGVRGIRLEKNDRVLGGMLLSRPSDALRVINSNDRQLSFGQMKYGVTSRGGKGVRTSQRNGFREILLSEIQLVDWTKLE